VVSLERAIAMNSDDYWSQRLLLAAYAAVAVQMRIATERVREQGMVDGEGKLTAWFSAQERLAKIGLEVVASLQSGLTELLQRRGVVPIENLPRVGKKLSRLVKPVESESLAKAIQTQLGRRRQQPV
jgi:hypothetical protein